MTVAPATSPGPAGRYDDRSSVAQRILATLLTLLVLGLIAAVVVALLSRAFNGNPTASVTGFGVTSDREGKIRFEVTKRSRSRAYCIVRARAQNGTEVGRDVAEVDREGTTLRTVQAEFLLATVARAVTGEVLGCSAEPISKVVDPAHH